MANAKHLQILDQGVEAWNAWRQENPAVRPDLRKADLYLEYLRRLVRTIRSRGHYDSDLDNADIAKLEDELDREAEEAEEELLAADEYGYPIRGADLRGINFAGADLADVDLTRARLDGADLSGADLGGAILSQAILLNGARLVGANMRKADLFEAQLNGADLSRSTLDGSDLGSARLEGARLIEASLRNANLSRAHLDGAHLIGAHLTEANLAQAKLTRAHLNRASLSGANLTDATLDHAILRKAFLFGANLNGAHLEGAILRRADLTCAALVRTRLMGADITGCHVFGSAAWAVELSGDTKQADLVITPASEPTITVDDIEVAQFLYLLLHNERVQGAIDTITTKVVLILGRFSAPERKAVLDALRIELREKNRGYVSVVFDFTKPRSQTTVETVTLLARMARFVIADLTDAKSVLQELQAIVPMSPKLAVQPIIVASQDEPGMLDFLQSFRSFCDLYRYEDPRHLLDDLDRCVIAPAEAKVNELRR